MRRENYVSEILAKMKESYEYAYQDKLCEVFLYGSYARGDYTEESDIDLVAIVDDERMNVQNALRQVWKDAADIGLEHDVMVSPLAIPLSEFKDYKEVLPLYKNISKEGIRIE